MMAKDTSKQAWSKKPIAGVNILKSINYVTCKISPIEDAKLHSGSRLKEIKCSWWLDGKRILVGRLIELSRQKA